MDHPVGTDPCRQWLGIEAIDLLHPHRVLGIAPEEADPVVIVRAADARLALLRELDPGPHAATRDALVTRVAEARDALLASATGRVPVPNVAPPRPPAGPRLVPPPVPGSIAPAEAPPWRSAADSPAPIVVRSPVGSRTAPSSGGGSALVAIVILAVAGVVAYLGWPLVARSLGVRPGADAAVRLEPPKAIGAGPWPARQDRVDRAAPPPPRRDAAARPSRPNVDEPAAAEPVDRGPEEAGRPEEPPAQVAQPARETTAAARSAGMLPPAEPGPPPAARDSAPSPEPRRFSDLLSAPDAEQAKPAPEPVKPQPAADDAALEAAIARAYEAMHAGTFDVAKQALDEAEAAGAGARKAADRVERWRRLEHYAREFDTYRDKALATAMGNDYPLGNTVISIVEVTDDTFEYRKLGQNIKVSRDAIPATVVHTIVNRWFAARPKPSNDLFLGAYLFTQGPRGTDLARRAWQRAADRGEPDGKTLLALFDDPLAPSADDDSPSAGSNRRDR